MKFNIISIIKLIEKPILCLPLFWKSCFHQNLATWKFNIISIMKLIVENDFMLVEEDSCYFFSYIMGTLLIFLLRNKHIYTQHLGGIRMLILVLDKSVTFQHIIPTLFILFEIDHFINISHFHVSYLSNYNTLFV